MPPPPQVCVYYWGPEWGNDKSMMCREPTVPEKKLLPTATLPFVFRKLKRNCSLLAMTIHGTRIATCATGIRDKLSWTNQPRVRKYGSTSSPAIMRHTSEHTQTSKIPHTSQTRSSRSTPAMAMALNLRQKSYNILEWLCGPALWASNGKMAMWWSQTTHRSCILDWAGRDQEGLWHHWHGELQKSAPTKAM